MIEQLRRLFSTATLREKVSYQSLEKVLTYLLNREIVFKGKVDLTQADVRGLSSGSSAWDDIKDKPASFPPSSHTHPEKQDTLVSGVNIKTVNTQALLGSGDITISGGVTSVNTQTGVVVLDADDISDSSTTNKFVTASDLTNLGNLSGVNSGDQDLSGLLPNTHLTDFAHVDIAHSNRAALDLVSGTNTGDEDLSGLVPYTGAMTNVALGANTLSTTSRLITPKVSPASDSTTAVQITKADGTTSIVNVDATNNRVGINTVSPSHRVDVFGSLPSDGVNTNVGYNIKRVTIPPNTMSGVATAGLGLNVGTYYYRVTFYNALGQTSPNSTALSVVTTAGNQQVALSNIPISTDQTVVGRKIYRSRVTDGPSYGGLLTTIADNTTSTYLDTTPDTSILPSFVLDRIVASIPNLTSNFISVDGVRSMIVDQNLTTFGFNAGASIVNGGTNCMFGAYAGDAITSGSGNNLFGYQAGTSLTSGYQNHAFGAGALASGTTAAYNIAIGPNVLYSNNGSGNIALGYFSGNATTGSFNVLIGSHCANSQSLGSRNLGIGDFISFPNPTGSDQLNIQNFIYGVTTATPRLGIDTTTPDRKLDIFDSSSPQLRLTHTDDTIYTDFQTDSSGYALIDPTGARLRVDGALLSLVLVEANTAGSGSPNVITASESRSVFTNEGTTALNYHTLPTAVAGLVYTFYVQDADGIRVVANTGDTIRIDTSVSASAGYAESTTVGSSVTLTAINATEWVATSVIGTWTLT